MRRDRQLPGPSGRRGAPLSHGINGKHISHCAGGQRFSPLPHSVAVGAQTDKYLAIEKADPTAKPPFKTVAYINAAGELRSVRRAVVELTACPAVSFHTPFASRNFIACCRKAMHVGYVHARIHWLMLLAGLTPVPGPHHCDCGWRGQKPHRQHRQKRSVGWSRATGLLNCYRLLGPGAPSHGVGETTVLCHRRGVSLVPFAN